MKIEKFIEKIIEAVKDELGTYVNVECKPVVKNNGVTLQGLTIRTDENNISPCIYLDSFYQKCTEEKMSVESAVAQILDIYKNSYPRNNFDISLFTDWEKAKEHLCCRLINSEKNRGLLKILPHRALLDLSVVYYVNIAVNGDGQGSILLTHDHLEMWGLEEEDLYRTALENMKYDFYVDSLGAICADMIGIEDISDEERFPLYVLSNLSRFYGAGMLLNDEAMNYILEKTAGEDFYILPSSVHETIIVPKYACDNVKHMANMVKEVNDTQVSETDLLSYHIYKYNAYEGQLEIAA